MFFRKKTKSYNHQEVIEGCLKGKQFAQKLLFEQYYSFVKRVCLRYASNHDETDEMLNDAFLKIFQKIQYHDPANSFEGWIRTVSTNTCIDYIRKHKNKYISVDIDEANFIEYDDEILDTFSAEDIMKLVQRLPDHFRAVFILHAVEGYSHPEIAEKLNINQNTSKSHLARARAKLQEWMIIEAQEKKRHDLTTNL